MEEPAFKTSGMGGQSIYHASCNVRMVDFYELIPGCSGQNPWSITWIWCLFFH